MTDQRPMTNDEIRYFDAILKQQGYRIVKDDPEHYVCFTEDSWFIEHSLDCRIAGTIGTCKFNRSIRYLTAEQYELTPGRWRIVGIGDLGEPILADAR